MMSSRKLELASNCCFCFSLATGVMIIATIDLLQGVLTVVLGAACLMMPDTLKGHPLGWSLGAFLLCFVVFDLLIAAHHLLYNETVFVAVIVMSGIGAVSAYFSWCAIKGIRSLSNFFSMKMTPLT